MLVQSYTPNIHTPTPIPSLYNPFTIADMARTFEFVLHFVGCVTVTVSPNQIIIIIIIIIIVLHKRLSAYMFRAAHTPAC